MHAVLPQPAQGTADKVFTLAVSLNHRLNIIGTPDLSAYGPEYATSRYTGTADLVAALK